MAMTLITNSADTDSTDLASITFDSGIDNTYKLFIFKFIDLNPATDLANFSFQANAVGASGYNETITSTAFNAFHNESDSNSGMTYQAALDQAQGAAYESLFLYCGSDADQPTTGTLWLFNPSNTTYVKHFYSRFSGGNGQEHCGDEFHSGYFNTTTAIDDINFKFSAGNFDGTIKLYGVGG